MTAHTLSHKIQLDPTFKQAIYFRKACGIARFTWNWALAQWREAYLAGEKPTGLQLKKAFNSLKEKEFPWIYEVTKYASQQPFIFLQTAFQRFFNHQSSYPKFKKKGVHDRFYSGNDHIQLKGRRIRIPKLGWVNMREVLRFSGKVLSATISRVADKWFVSLNVVLDQPMSPCKSQARVGVDLGIKRLAILSDGTEFEGPKPLATLQRKLKRKQRQLSRTNRGSKNREKARMEVARLYYRMACSRNDALHKLTNFLCQCYVKITIEDLNIKGMMKNRRLAKSISDMGFYEFRRQLDYKAKLHNNTIEIASRWFPSSKMCSTCHALKKELTLSDRVFECDECHLQIDRDLNAAINLLNSTVSSTGFQACGEEGAGSIGRV